MHRLLIFPSLIIALLLTTTATAQEIRRFDDAGRTTTTTSKLQSTHAGETKKEGKADNFVTVFNSNFRKQRGIVNLPPEKLYRGIIPGTRDSMPHVEHAKQNNATNTLTWVGFQPNKDGSARIFIQTASNADYEKSSDGTHVQITLSATTIPLRNFSRFIDTSFFGNNVQRIESKQVGDDVIITISLKESASPSIQKDGNYLYLSF